MKATVTQVRTTRDNKDMSYSEDDLDLSGVIEVLLSARRSRDRFDEGKSTFSIKPLTITIEL